MGRPTDEPLQRDQRDLGSAETEDGADVAPEIAPEPPEPAPLLELRDGLPPVVDTPEAYARVVEAFAAGTGPVAIDAERASGYRYSARAYLVQLRREGAGTALIDPIAFDDLSALHDALGDAEWILHAATQDLSCLAEVGLRPTTLFDTELAGRLLGLPAGRPGHPGRGRGGEQPAQGALRGRLVDAAAARAVAGVRRPRRRGAAGAARGARPRARGDRQGRVGPRGVRAPGDRSTRRPAAGPVASHVRHAPRTRPARPGRRTRALGDARRDRRPQRDVTPGRIIPDSAIVEAANALPRDKAALLAVRGFRGRGAERYAHQWVEALRVARALPDEELPPVAARYDGPPPPRAWADRDPVAAARLAKARESLKALADSHDMPVENLLTPDYVRRVMWEPPQPDEGEDLSDLVAQRLTALGARPWQVELARGPLTDAITTAKAAASS